MMAVLAEIAAIVGLAQALVASWLVTAFVRRPRIEPMARPAVTVLKPLHGDEPLLEEALATVCEQDYPAWQVVFGVHHAADPAVAVVRRLEARFPDADIALVIDPALHGANRKVGNLINMLPAAKYDVLVIADSDIHARPDYLTRLVAALQQPAVGLVTTLYAGLPVRSPGLQQLGLGKPLEACARIGLSRPPINPRQACAAATSANSSVDQAAKVCLASRLGATQITHGFLPGAVLARALGREDCLGATMCLRREDLERIGGFHALVDHLADDNVLGRRIHALGLRVALAQTVPLTTVPEATVRALFRHELRWARTIRALEPIGFAASVLQYPLAWALLAVGVAGGALWSIGVCCLAWVLRAVAAAIVDRALTPLWQQERSGGDNAALAFRCPVWLLPLRDILSVAVMLASYGGRHVDWRGHGLQADRPPLFTKQSVTPRR
jgi:ceramide glucosyltransferase